MVKREIRKREEEEEEVICGRNLWRRQNDFCVCHERLDRVDCLPGNKKFRTDPNSKEEK